MKSKSKPSDHMAKREEVQSKNKLRDKDAGQLGSASKNNVAINKHIQASLSRKVEDLIEVF